MLRIPTSLLNIASDSATSSTQQPPLDSVSGEPGHYRLAPEPVHPARAHPTAHLVLHTAHTRRVPMITGAQPRAANAEALIMSLQRQFPNAHVRITGRGRTVRRQAELMAQRRRSNRSQFLNTYRPAHHITEMDNWATSHPHATEAVTVGAFEDIINRARAHGAVVSNHLSDRARDISIPIGAPSNQHQIRNWLTNQGAHVIDEHDATGGPHWHVDYDGSLPVNLL